MTESMKKTFTTATDLSGTSPKKSDDVLVRVENVSKKFCRDLKRSLWYGVKDLGSELLCRRHNHDGELRKDEFWAVKDIIFELRRGECLGLIGRNGAGKTTLLRMLNGLIKPDCGRIEMRGRVGALIALGAGFNPILTGRENVYVNASILGLNNAEIEEKIEEIIEFAEIGDFIESPVQTYSSGMQVRLGFAIATKLNPDILLLDEVLAVGDAEFRFKCYKIIDDLLNSAAVIFVSHNMPDVYRVCSKTMYLEKGVSMLLGNTENCINLYQQRIKNDLRHVQSFKNVFPPLIAFEVEAPKAAEFNKPYSFQITVSSMSYCDNIQLILNFFNSHGSYASNVTKEASKFGIKIKKGCMRWCFNIQHLPLKPGLYHLAFHLIQDGKFLASISKKHTVEISGGNPASVSDCILEIDSWTEQILNISDRNETSKTIKPT
jgi:lipopolysaccharide transport system ATP-binding protein